MTIDCKVSKWKRITVQLPRSLADAVDQERQATDRKFGPELIRLAKEGLSARQRARIGRELLEAEPSLTGRRGAGAFAPAGDGEEPPVRDGEEP